MVKLCIIKKRERLDYRKSSDGVAKGRFEMKAEWREKTEKWFSAIVNHWGCNRLEIAFATVGTETGL